MGADQASNKALDWKGDSETHTKSSTYVAGTGTKQANKRESNMNELDEREAYPQLSLIVELRRDPRSPAQKAAKAQKFESIETE